MRLLQPENISGRRPLVVYMHRYPPEYENQQFCGMAALNRAILEKYDLLYVSMAWPRPPDPELRRGMALLELPMAIDPASGRDKLLKTALYYCLFPRVLRELRRLNPDVIMCKEPLPRIPIRAARLGKPVLLAGVSDHWYAILLGWNALGRKLARLLERREVSKWRKLNFMIIANTLAEKNVMIRHGANADRIRVVNTTCPAGIFHPCEAGEVRRGFNFPPNAVVFAIHGTIRPGKGYSQLLEWWKRLATVHPEWRLLIIGGAGGENWCRRRVARLGLKDAVKMTGWLPTQGDVNLNLNAADILLALRNNTPDNEGIIPSLLYHNLSVGKPTIATALPGMAEIVRDRRDGYLYEPDNYESFKAVLEYVASHPREAAAVAQAGRARAIECFSTEKSVEGHMALLEELLEERGDRSEGGEVLSFRF